ALVAAAGPAPAQDYPTRPIKALTTTSAGGISDVFMRALGDELHKRWGQPIIVENRPGGMQNLGARACTEAPPDGYTVCILNAEPVAYNQFLLKSMPFDPEKRLQPITNLYHLLQTLVVLNNIRSPNFPDVPTLEETGYKGVPSRSWYGLFAPAGTPKPIVDKIAKDVASIVSDPGFRERHLTARSLVPATNTPEQFAE